jgi:hypothetical protein
MATGFWTVDWRMQETPPEAEIFTLAEDVAPTKAPSIDAPHHRDAGPHPVGALAQGAGAPFLQRLPATR